MTTTSNQAQGAQMTPEKDIAIVTAKGLLGAVGGLVAYMKRDDGEGPPWYFVMLTAAGAFIALLMTWGYLSIHGALHDIQTEQRALWQKMATTNERLSAIDAKLCTHMESVYPKPTGGTNGK